MKKKLKSKPTSYINNLEDFLDKYYPSLTASERAKRIVTAEIRVALDKYANSLGLFRRLTPLDIFSEILSDLKGFGE